MATQTTNLGLKKWDTQNPTDLNSNFDIDSSMNDNWDKIDTAVGEKANTTDVNIALATKVDKQEGYSLISASDLAQIQTNKTDILTKANKTYVDEELAEKVDKVAGKELISTTDLAQIQTNAQNILQRSLITETGSQIQLTIDTDYKMTAILKDKNGNTIYTSNVIDLPLETMIVNASYDNATKEIVLTLQNGNTTRFSVADLVNGLVSTATFNEALSNKVDKVNGKGLSTNDFTNEYKEQIETNASDILDINEAQTTQDNRIAELEEENELLRKDLAGLPTNTATGESIDITDSAEMRFEKLDVGGNSKQNTTEGKNLLTFKNVSNRTLLNVAETFNNSEFKLSGTTSDAGILIPQNTNLQITLAPGTYTISYRIKTGTITNIGSGKDIVIYLKDSLGNDINTSPLSILNAHSLTSETFTISEEQTLYFHIYCNSSGITLNNLVIQAQLEEGSTATEYEPYTGGQPSPNPEYEQPVHSVGDNGSASVTIGNKNLCNYEESITYWAGANIKSSGTTIIYTPTSGGVMGLEHTTKRQKINISKGTVITFSQECYSGNPWTSGALTNTLSLVDKNGKITSLRLDDFTPSNFRIKHSKKITLSSDIVEIYSVCLSYAVMGATTPIIMKCQLEQSSTTSSYTPHAHQTYIIPTQQPMRKIGDYADTFVRENGLWYEKHKIYSLSFTGEENWEWGVNGALIHQEILAEAFSDAMCNYFINSKQEVWLNKHFGVNSTGTTLWFKDYDKFTTLQEWTAWVKAKKEIGIPLTIKYILKTPILLPCTPEQTAVLEEIRKKAKTYKGGTHIYSTDEVSPIFDVEYHVDMQSENENLQSQLDSLEARVSLLEGGE